MTKSIVVTGAGTGIGRAIAVTLSNQGKIILCGRREHALIETQKILCTTYDHKVIPLDVTDADSLSRYGAALESEDVYAVIANHGIGGADVIDAEDRFDLIAETNFTGTYRLIQASIDALKKSTFQNKHILVMSSILARMGVPQYAAYCGSKSAVLGLTRAWAMEYASESILVNAICPGWVNTQMAQEGIALFATAANLTYDEALEEQMSLVPLAKMSEPEEVADLVEFLVSAKNKSITGQAFDINNGAFLA